MLIQFSNSILGTLPIKFLENLQSKFSKIMNGSTFVTTSEDVFGPIWKLNDQSYFKISD